MRDNRPLTAAIETGNLKNYFYQSLSEICDRRSVDSQDDSIAYIVNLLCDYARSDRLFVWDKEIGFNLRPLALMYGDAIEAQDLKQRATALRRLGDVALFISGIFNASLSRKPVGVDYYINMGGGAYGWLSENLEISRHTSLDHELFRDLSLRFARYVSVLEEFSENTVLRKDKDLIALQKLWQERNDPHFAEKTDRETIAVSDESNRLIH